MWPMTAIGFGVRYDGAGEGLFLSHKELLLIQTDIPDFGTETISDLKR